MAPASDHCAPNTSGNSCLERSDRTNVGARATSSSVLNDRQNRDSAAAGASRARAASLPWKASAKVPAMSATGAAVTRCTSENCPAVSAPKACAIRGTGRLMATTSMREDTRKYVENDRYLRATADI